MSHVLGYACIGYCIGVSRNIFTHSKLWSSTHCVQYSLGTEKVAGRSVAECLCNSGLRRADSTTDSLRTQESHRSWLHQSSQVDRHRSHDNDNISRSKVPLIPWYITRSDKSSCNDCCSLYHKAGSVGLHVDSLAVYCPYIVHAMPAVSVVKVRICFVKPIKVSAFCNVILYRLWFGRSVTFAFRLMQCSTVLFVFDHLSHVQLDSYVHIGRVLADDLSFWHVHARYFTVLLTVNRHLGLVL